jgi:hypothetical protein
MPLGAPTKLSPTLQATICEAIRSIVPLHWAFRYAGVSDQTMRNWRATATKAAAKKHSARSKHERACIAFFGAVEAAQADAFMRGVAVIEAGSRPSYLVKETTTTKDDVTVTVRETKEIAGDWRAMAHLMARVFADDMAGRIAIESEENAPIRVVTTEEVWDELQAYRRAKEARAIADKLPMPMLAQGNGKV